MTRGPIYVHVENEQEVLDLIDELKEDLLSAKKLLHELYDIRAEENKQVHDVKQRIAQMRSRIEVIDEEVLT